MGVKKTAGMVVLAAVVVGGGFVYLNFGSILTQTAEKIASGALGVKVDIGAINVSLSDKKVTVNSIKIANPPGYSKPHAVTVDSVKIGLNTASKELIDFNDIQVKGSVVNLEVNEKGMNLNDLKALAARKEQKESAGSEQVRVIVQHMVIDSTTINPSISILDREIKPIHMPAITFSKMGSGSGMDANAAIEQVLTRYLSEVQKAAREGGMLNGLPGELGDIKKNLGGVAADKLKNLLR
jgi:hypothetical protein